MVGLPMISYQRSTGSWLVTMVDRRSILDDLKQVTTLLVVELLGSPIVEDEQVHLGQAAQHLGVAAVTARQGEGGKQPGGTVVGDGEILPAELWPRAQASQLLPTPVGPVSSKPCRARIQPQPASLRKSPRSRPRATRKSTSSTLA